MAPRRAFAYCVLLGHPDDASPDVEPQVLFRYPATDHADVALPDNLVAFCLVDPPEAPVNIHPSVFAPSPRFFATILTDVNGKRLYCGVLQYTHASSRGHGLLPRSLCLLSEYSMFDAMRSITTYLFGSFALAPSTHSGSLSSSSSTTTIGTSSTTLVSATIATDEALDAAPDGEDADGQTCSNTRNSLQTLRGLSHTPRSHNQQFKDKSKMLFIAISRLIDRARLVPGCRTHLHIGRQLTPIFLPPLNRDTIGTSAPVLPLFRALPIQDVLTLISAIFTEQRIVFRADSYWRVAEATEALMTLLHPFRFQHVYIPVLPGALLDILGAPTPFVVGIHACFSDAPHEFNHHNDSSNTNNGSGGGRSSFAFQQPTRTRTFEEAFPDVTDVLVVDLDLHTLTVPDSCLMEIPPLSEPYASRVHSFVEFILEPDACNADTAFRLPDSHAVTHSPHDQNLALRAVFLEMFASLFGAFRDHLLFVRVHPQPVVLFDANSFLHAFVVRHGLPYQSASSNTINKSGVIDLASVENDTRQLQRQSGANIFGMSPLPVRLPTTTEGTPDVDSTSVDTRFIIAALQSISFNDFIDRYGAPSLTSRLFDGFIDHANQLRDQIDQHARSLYHYTQQHADSSVTAGTDAQGNPTLLLSSGISRDSSSTTQSDSLSTSTPSPGRSRPSSMVSSYSAAKRALSSFNSQSAPSDGGGSSIGEFVSQTVAKLHEETARSAAATRQLSLQLLVPSLADCTRAGLPHIHEQVRELSKLVEPGTIGPDIKLVLPPGAQPDASLLVPGATLPSLIVSGTDDANNVEVYLAEDLDDHAGAHRVDSVEGANTDDEIAVAASVAAAIESTLDDASPESLPMFAKFALKHVERESDFPIGDQATADTVRRCLVSLFSSATATNREELEHRAGLMIPVLRRLFRDEWVRVFFARELEQYSSAHKNLRLEQFHLLVRLVNCVLRDESDALCSNRASQLLLPLLSIFYHDLNGTPECLYFRTSDHVVFQDTTFWTTTFFMRLQTALGHHYLMRSQADLAREVARTLDDEAVRRDVVRAEEEVVYIQITVLVSQVIWSGLGDEFALRVLDDIGSSNTLSTKQLEEAQILAQQIDMAYQKSFDVIRKERQRIDGSLNTDRLQPPRLVARELFLHHQRQVVCLVERESVSGVARQTVPTVPSAGPLQPRHSVAFASPSTATASGAVSSLAVAVGGANSSSLVCALGSLYITNYRIIFRGYVSSASPAAASTTSGGPESASTPDSRSSKAVVERSIPLHSIIRLRRMPSAFLPDLDVWAEGLELQSALFHQLRVCVLDEGDQGFTVETLGSFLIGRIFHVDTLALFAFAPSEQQHHHRHTEASLVGTVGAAQSTMTPMAASALAVEGESSALSSPHGSLDVTSGEGSTARGSKSASSTVVGSELHAGADENVSQRGSRVLLRNSTVDDSVSARSSFSVSGESSRHSVFSARRGLGLQLTHQQVVPDRLSSTVSGRGPRISSTFEACNRSSSSSSASVLSSASTLAPRTPTSMQTSSPVGRQGTMNTATYNYLMRKRDYHDSPTGSGGLMRQRTIIMGAGQSIGSTNSPGGGAAGGAGSASSSSAAAAAAAAAAANAAAVSASSYASLTPIEGPVLLLNKSFPIPLTLLDPDQCIEGYERHGVAVTIVSNADEQLWTEVDREVVNARAHKAFAPWRMSSVNVNYSLSFSFPPCLVVPKSLTDVELRAVATCFRQNRIPVLAWQHPFNRSVLVRGAALRKPEQQQRHGLDSDMDPQSLVRHVLSSVMLATPRGQDADNWSNVPALYVMTHRFNCRRGGGQTCESGGWAKGFASLDHVEFLYVDDASSHYPPDLITLRQSRSKLANACCGVTATSFSNAATHSSSSDSDSTFLSAVQQSHWLTHVASLLEASLAVADLIHVQGSSVMVALGDGRDRTTQIVSLAQILLDPYHRTMRGFLELVQREWLSFGHAFSTRCAPTSGGPIVASSSKAERGVGAAMSPEKKGNARGGKYNGLLATPDTDTVGFSPVFLLWLDAVYQLLWQFPSSFAFSPALLERLFYHSHAGRFASFLFDSSCERAEKNINGASASSMTTPTGSIASAQASTGGGGGSGRVSASGSLNSTTSGAVGGGGNASHPGSGSSSGVNGPSMSTHAYANAQSLWLHLEQEDRGGPTLANLKYNPHSHVSQGCLRPFTRAAAMRLWPVYLSHAGSSDFPSPGKTERLAMLLHRYGQLLAVTGEADVSRSTSWRQLWVSLLASVRDDARDNGSGGDGAGDDTGGGGGLSSGGGSPVVIDGTAATPTGEVGTAAQVLLADGPVGFPVHMAMSPPASPMVGKHAFFDDSLGSGAVNTGGALGAAGGGGGSLKRNVVRRQATAVHRRNSLKPVVAGRQHTIEPMSSDGHSLFRNQHQFETFNSLQPSACDHCHQFLWGVIIKQGFRCRECNFVCHDKCRALVTTQCHKERRKSARTTTPPRGTVAATAALSPPTATSAAAQANANSGSNATFMSFLRDNSASPTPEADSTIGHFRPGREATTATAAASTAAAAAAAGREASSRLALQQGKKGGHTRSMSDGSVVPETEVQGAVTDPSPVSASTFFTSTVHEGYLHKTGGRVRTWKHRYFVLSGDVIRYYSTAARARLKGQIALRDVQVVQPIEEVPVAVGRLALSKDAKGAFFFEVVTDFRSYALCAESSDERVRWIHALTKQLVQVRLRDSGPAAKNSAAVLSAQHYFSDDDET